MPDRTTEAAKVFRLTRLANGWQVGRFPVLERLGIAHLISTRHGPDVNTIRYQPDRIMDVIAHALDLPAGAYLKQTHGGEVLQCQSQGLIGNADALYTSQPGIALIGKSADCPLILVAEKSSKAVGFAHASWRSTVAGITKHLINEITEQLHCHTDNLIACICPSAGPECYEVGPEIRDAALKSLGSYADTFFTRYESKLHFDLWKANTDTLLKSGLQPEHIHVARLCTLCENDLFPSHRKEGDHAGRFVAAIGLTQQH